MSSKELTQVKFRLNADELEVWQQKANERNMTLPKFSKQIVNQVITQGKLKQPKINQEQGAEVIGWEPDVLYDDPHLSTINADSIPQAHELLDKLKYSSLKSKLESFLKGCEELIASEGD